MAKKGSGVSHARVVYLRVEKNLLLEEIGKKLGITRERVRQILEAEGIPPKIPRDKCPRCGKGKSARFIACWYCRSQMKAKKTYLLEDLDPVRKMGPKVMICPGWGERTCGKRLVRGKKTRYRGMCQACYQNWRYHNVPGLKEKMAERSYRWHKRELKRNPEYKQRFTEYQRLWHQRKAAEK